jgi:hypothetical protein
MKTGPLLKWFIVSLAILCPTLLWAKSVPVNTARKVAVNHLNKNNQVHALQQWQKGQVPPPAVGRKNETDITQTITTSENGIVVYYVFNLVPEGWIIVSADDSAYPVIGYSETGRYDPEKATQPPAFMAWMDNAAAQIADAAALGLEPLPDAASAWNQLSAAPDHYAPDLGELAGADTVSPLVQSTWGQGTGEEFWLFNQNNNSYNQFCPWDYNTFLRTHWNFCPTGCVATAMAQIMRYWQWPLFGSGSHSYDPANHCTYDCSSWGLRWQNFSGRTYTWTDASMPLHNPSHDIALLMYDIGVAVEMDYSLSASSAYFDEVPGALHAYFRYNGYQDSKSPSDPDGWAKKLKDELNLGRPILYKGDTHVFICDGYNASGDFHFNWGWDGSCDGWFRLNALTPCGHDYTWAQRAIFGVTPITAADVFVDDDYYDGAPNDGHTWDIDAFNDIQKAITIVSPGGTIHVAPGAYNGPIDFKGKPMRLYAADGAGIYGNGAYHVIKCVSGEGPGTIIEGFSISGGNAVGTSNLEKCGGGMVNYNSSPTIINCSFSGNSAGLHGGGMHNENSSPTLIKCSFWDNHAGAHGGGLMNNSYSFATVTNCGFIGNSAGSGGGGIGNSWYGTLNLVNCTIAENTAAMGGGIYNYYSNTTAANCIFWADSKNEIVNDGSVSNITYSDIQGDYPGTGNINADPGFNPIFGGYDLGSRSLCLDAGNNAAVPAGITTDLDGQPRFVDSCRPDTGKGTPPIVDMGAYESQSTWYSPRNNLANPGFEPGDTGGWFPTGNSVLTAVTEQAHNGVYSGLVGNRTDSGQGVQKWIPLYSDSTYRMSGWVRLQNAQSDEVRLTLRYVDSAGAHESLVDRATVHDNQWALLDGTFVLKAKGNVTEAYLYFVGPAVGVNFYIDDAAVTEVISDLDRNGKVDLIDFDLFARYYERHCATQDCGPADLEKCDYADTVNEHDLAILIAEWLAGSE